MKIHNSIKTILIIFYASVPCLAQHQDYPITPVPFSKVKIEDSFWSPKIKTNHVVTIPIAYQQSLKTGRVDNFKIAANLMEGQFCTEYPFDDTDIYKIIEAASYSIHTFPDREMELMMDSLISLIAGAQEADGYLYTTRTIGANMHPWAGKERWELVHELSHELYNLGHMFEAATAHYSATGKRSFLDVAIKSADLICDEFGEGKIMNYPGHQEVEIGLIKLYRVTKDERYLNQAKFFLEMRGKPGIGNPKKYDQSHLPVTLQTEAVGHAVRGSYMWAAMADIAAITGDQSYLSAIKSIWNDIVNTKYYINGGIGATGSGEAFGDAYELPNMSAYCETCAGVGNAMWNHRMFLMTGECKYVDVLERTMYNNILDGVSLSGDHFFYPNPLASYGQHQRSTWFGCACCPPNVARFLPSMPGYIYASQDNDIYVNLYLSSLTKFDFGTNSIALDQESGFPWDGSVKITLDPSSAQDANLKLRVPGYVRNRPVPSDLYRYANEKSEQFELQLNGKATSYIIDDKGYITLSRKWQKGDVIEMEFPMEIQKVKAHKEVKADEGKVAFERGPLLYCAEWPDNPENKVLSLIVDPKSQFSLEKSHILGGCYTIEGKGRHASRRLDGSIEVSDEGPLKLIPYHLWNNRGPGEMSVWLATGMDYTMPSPAPTIARNSEVTASVRSKAIIAVNDQLYPSNSNDHSLPYLHWWPRKGTEEWVQLDFDEVARVSSLKVYWFDDGPHGGCRIPAAWKVEYKDGDSWREVENKDDYQITKDNWDFIEFEPVSTEAVRLVIILPEEYATGLYEVIIE
jgi:DUF1680 family protein